MAPVEVRLACDERELAVAQVVRIQVQEDDDAVTGILARLNVPDLHQPAAILQCFVEVGILGLKVNSDGRAGLLDSRGVLFEDLDLASDE